MYLYNKMEVSARSMHDNIFMTICDYTHIYYLLLVGMANASKTKVRKGFSEQKSQQAQ